MPINALVLDDELIWREILSELLNEEGYKVQLAENLSQAKKLLANGRFHLVFIDIVLTGDVIVEGGESGLDLLSDISKFSQQVDRFCAPIILTGNPQKEQAVRALMGASPGFFTTTDSPVILKRGRDGKGFEEEEFLSICRKVLRRVLLERERLYDRNSYMLRFDLTPRQKTNVELSGSARFFRKSRRPLELDLDDFAGRTDDLQFHFSAVDSDQRLKWRPRAQKIGQDLYNKVFSEDSGLMGSLASARAHSDHALLHFVFRGAPEMLRCPLELLPGDISYLITENPLIRQISGVATSKEGISRLFTEDSEIKILLIASDTKPSIPGVNEEIALLEDEISKLYKSRGFNCSLRTIATEEATYDNVRAALENCQYHIVHYAGHGFHNKKYHDESGLVFWNKPNRSGGTKPMPIRVLKNLLRHSETRFFYLSCCVGAETSAEASVQLNGDDFQGILEGLVRLGIPGVLGYRWNVWDTEAQQLALAFYENLLTDLRLDLALFKARRTLEENNYYNETWASPVLVVQDL